MNRRIKKLEHKLLRVDSEDTNPPKFKLSLKQLKRRLEKLEKKVESLNQQKQPKLSTCLKLLLPEARHWHNLGSLLEVPEPTLEQIEADYPGDCQQCVREMIKSWLKQADPPPSWRSLANAVQTVNPNLEKKILKCTIVQK